MRRVCVGESCPDRPSLRYSPRTGEQPPAFAFGSNVGEAGEEFTQTINHPRLHPGSGITVSEGADGRQDAGDGCSGNRHISVTEGRVHERVRFGWQQVFLGDDLVKLAILRFSDILRPCLVDIGPRRECAKELLDQILLGAQVGVGVDGAPDLDGNFLVLAIVIVILGGF